MGRWVFVNQKYEKEARKHKANSIIAILCGVIPLVFFGISYALTVTLGRYSQNDAFIDMFNHISHYIVVFFIAVFQILLLLKGIRVFVQKVKVGKTFLIISILFIIISTVLNSIYHFLTYNPSTFDFIGSEVLLPYGALTWTIPGLLLSNISLLILYIFSLISALGATLSFSILLLKLDNKTLLYDLKLPSLFYLTQTLSCGALFVGVSGLGILVPMMFLILAGLLTWISFLILGVKLWHF
jgi:hypothetical protein